MLATQHPNRHSVRTFTLADLRVGPKSAKQRGMGMKNVLLTGTAVALAVYAPAHAADLAQRPVYKAPPPMLAQAPFFSW
jgi:hypothetical protein